MITITFQRFRHPSQADHKPALGAERYLFFRAVYRPGLTPLANPTAFIVLM